MPFYRPLGNTDLVHRWTRASSSSLGTSSRPNVQTIFGETIVIRWGGHHTSGGTGGKATVHSNLLGEAIVIRWTGNSSSNSSGTSTSSQNIVEGTFQCNGSTSLSIDSIQSFAATWQGDGSTSVSIDPRQIYTSTNLFNMDGATSVSITTTHVFDIGWEGDGSTTVSITSRQVYAAGWEGDGSTTVSITPAQAYAVQLQADGATAFTIRAAQDQFGEITFDQIDQVISALGSFVFTDGALNANASSTLTPHGTAFVLGPDYISGIIVNNKEAGAPDFIPVFSDSFTASLKTAIGTGTGDLGRINYKRVLGVSRATSALTRRVMNIKVGEEWVRVVIAVDDEIDFPEMNGTIGFSAGGIAAIAGYGLVGREKEEYATYSILTNAINTQTTLEVLAAGDPSVDVTQVCYEMLWIKQGAALNTQTTTEVLYLANLAAINQVAAEMLAGGTGGNLTINSVVLEMIHSIKARTDVTQVVTEVVGTGDPKVQNTQTCIEMLFQETVSLFATLLLQQAAVECLGNEAPNLLVQSVVAETIHNNTPNLLIQSTVIECVENGNPNALIDSEAIETMHNGTPILRVEQIAIEMLIRSEYDPTVAGLVNNPRYPI